MIFAIEQNARVWDEVMSLVHLNAAETGALSAEDLNPDKARYQQLEDVGALVVFTARADQKLVGYMYAHVFRHLQFSSTTWAVQDVLFVHKEHRGVGAVKFLKFIDESLKSAGVDYVLRQVHKNNDYSRTLERLGYEFVEKAYMRRL
jgi:L-amino acid N-acyltransferase YncA